MNDKLDNYISKKDNDDKEDWGKLVDEDRDSDRQPTCSSMDRGGGGNSRYDGGAQARRRWAGTLHGGRSLPAQNMNYNRSRFCAKEFFYENTNIHSKYLTLYEYNKFVCQ